MRSFNNVASNFKNAFMLNRSLIFLSVLFLSFSSSSLTYGQCSWSALGPDDANQPSYNNTNYSKVRAYNNTLYVAYYSIGEQIMVKKHNGTSWSTVGASNIALGTFTDLCLDGSGVPYVVYSDAQNSYRASVKKFDGTNWVVVGAVGFSAGQVSYCRIAIDGSNVPYVVYQDWTASGKATVKKFDGANWVNVGTAAFTSGSAEYPAIAVTSAGVPYVLFGDFPLGTLARCYKFDGTNWVNTGLGSAGASLYNDITIASDGNPYVVYRDAGNSYRPYVQRYNGTSWINIGTMGAYNMQGDWCSIALDASNVPHIAIKGGSNLLAIRKWNGTFWADLGGASNSISDALHTSLTFNSSGELFVGYTEAGDIQKTYVKKFNGTSWNVVGTEGFSPYSGQDVALKLDANRTPYASYVDRNYKMMNVMKYSGGTWTSLGSNISASNAFGSDLALSATGEPFVSYRDLANSNKITVKKYDGTSWNIIGTAGFSAGTVSYTSIAIDASGNPYVAYCDEAAGDRVTVMRFNGTSWVVVGAANFSSGASYEITLRLDGSGTPYVAFRNSGAGNMAFVMRYNGTSWVDVGTAGVSSGTAYDLRMALDGSTPYIVFKDGDNSSKATVMKFDGANWVFVGTAGFTSTSASSTDIAIFNGTPYISYIYLGMNVMKFNGASWINLGSSDFSVPNSTYGRIQVDNLGNPHIAFSNGRLFAKRFGLNVNVGSSPSTVCSGTTLTLTNSVSGGTYSWSGPNGFTSSAQNPTISSVSTSASGTYTVLTTDANSCSGLSTHSVTVNSSPTATALASPSTLCAGSNVSLTAGPNGMTTYSWSGPNSFTSSSQNPSLSSVSTSAGGNYILTVINNLGCAGNQTVSLTVNPKPVPLPSANSTTICSGFDLSLSAAPNGMTGYSWAGPNSFTSSSQQPVISAAATSSSGTYSITVVDGNGCTGSATLSVLVNPTPAAVANSNNITPCSGSSLTLSSTPGGMSSYAWSGPNSYTASVQNPAITNISTLGSGSYSVTITHANSCSGTSSVNITVLTTPSVSYTATPSTTVCQGTSLTLSGLGASNYVWTGGITNGVGFIPSGSQSYTVTGTDANGCSSSSTASVSVQSLPNISVTQNGPVLTANQAGATYQWVNCPTMTPVSGATAQSFTATVSGQYAVIVTQNNCPDTSSCYTVNLTSINESAGAADFIVFPNPAKDYIIIESAASSQIIITDLSGKKILSFALKAGQTKVDLDLSSGIYLIRDEFKGGTRKLIIE